MDKFDLQHEGQKESPPNIDRSKDQGERKRILPSPIELDTTLPINDLREEIAATILAHPVVIISGETGSGKSTQLPLIALQAGFGRRGLIGHTQPRRIAARSVAERVASQLKSPLGEVVGFKIRFHDRTQPQTCVKLMTDGILLAETQLDRYLHQYELIIIDEAHERSLNIDFLIGNLKRILQRRSDLKVIVTSATIDTDRFAEHFALADGSPAPVIAVPGRTYPVDIRFWPPEALDHDSEDIVSTVVTAVRKVIRDETGDMLVFLPTEADIRAVSKKLRGDSLQRGPVEVVPLYARLTSEQQHAVFNPGPMRRVILATNVAESSITVPRIRVVIDCGLARISRYAPRSKVQRLPIEAISQASANQRAGRCGRLGPGICLRLYSEDDFLSRPRFTTPEIRRTNLAAVILQTLALRMGDVNSFPFIDPPQAESIADGYRTLFEIGALDSHRRLTRLGRWLSRLPVDPRIGRMLYEANQESCLSEVLIIAAALEIQDPRLRPLERQQQADESHARFRDPKSDFLSFLKIWDFFHGLREKLSRSKFDAACHQHFLSTQLIGQWQEIHRQLKALVSQQGFQLNERRDDYAPIHRSLLAGLLSGIAMLSDKHEYTGGGGIKFHLWPGSGLFQSKPKWIVVAELVETARRYGRTVAVIDPQWLEPMSAHLLKVHFVDPHWSSKQQTAMAYQNVSLFGLPIIARRRVGYATVDPEWSRRLFIEQGLVLGEMRDSFEFLAHNRSLIEELQRLAAKTRRADWLVESSTLTQFYESRLPDDCPDVAALRRALRKQPELNHRLRLSASDLGLEGDPSHVPKFPDEVQIGRMKFPVHYQFEPGSQEDGATIRLPREALTQLNDAVTPWLVPGLLEARVTNLIKSLPKSVRRLLVPAQETAQRICSTLTSKSSSFETEVARQLSIIAGQTISPDQFDISKVQECWKINLQVVDDQGAVEVQGRNILELRKQMGLTSQNVVDVATSPWHQDGLTDWTWGEIPFDVVVAHGFADVTLYPTIVDQSTAVGLRLLDDQRRAESQMVGGLIRLFALKSQRSLKRQLDWLPSLDRQALKLNWAIGIQPLQSGIRDLIARIAFLENQCLPRTKDEFERRLAESVERISIATQDIARWLPQLADGVHTVRLALDALRGQAKREADSIADLDSQISLLIHQDFLQMTPWTWLQHFPRYLSAIKIRCEKLIGGAAEKDRESTVAVSQFWQPYLQMKMEHGMSEGIDSPVVFFRWMIEEYRVSLFAQNLGTSMKVSAQRLEKQRRKILEM